MKTLLLLIVLAAFFAPTDAIAQLTERRVENLETRVRTIERESRSYTAAAFIGAVLAALWAQNTLRNSWLWFFVTLFFAPIALLVLLYKNSVDVRNRR
jgi:4-hydroxybenzoate polyprenyltransferase